MDRKQYSSHAIVLRGRCDLDDRPCRPGIGLLDRAMNATGTCGGALPDDFSLDATVDIATCPRPCRLTLAIRGRSASVGRDSEILAEASDPASHRRAFLLDRLTDRDTAAPHAC